MNERSGQAAWQPAGDGVQDYVPPRAGDPAGETQPVYASPVPPVPSPAMPAPPCAAGMSYSVVINGAASGPYPLPYVQSMIRDGQVIPSTPVSVNGQAWQSAGSVPGLYSDRSMVIALVLSVLFGTLGVDRFYLGQVGLGLAKLFLSWMTLGVWQLIDIVLIALRKVNDAQGRPLR